MRAVTVSAPSRIHVTLVDLSGDLGRLDGGVGFAISLPRTVVRAEPSEELEVLGPRSSEVEAPLRALGLKAKVVVESTSPPHSGFGSTTQLKLAALKAVSELYGLGLSARDLAVLAGRGGTSGIGVAAFEGGGFVVDFGHDADLKERPLPSGASLTTPPPFLRLPFPEDWYTVVVYPRKGGLYDEVREVGVFEEKAPIAPEESAKAARIIMMLLMPAIIERRLDLWQRGVNELQKVGFKAIEVEIQPPAVKEAMDVVRRITGSAGLSSMGPAIYSVVPIKKARIVANKVREELGDEFEVKVVPPDNKGAEVLITP